MAAHAIPADLSMSGSDRRRLLLQVAATDALIDIAESLRTLVEMRGDAETRAIGRQE